MGIRARLGHPIDHHPSCGSRIVGSSDRSADHNPIGPPPQSRPPASPRRPDRLGRLWEDEFPGRQGRDLRREPGADVARRRQERSTRRGPTELPVQPSPPRRSKATSDLELPGTSSESPREVAEHRVLRFGVRRPPSRRPLARLFLRRYAPW